MKTKKIFFKLFLTFLAIVALNCFIMSCDKAHDDSGKIVFLNQCIVSDSNKNELLIHRGDSAILLNDNLIKINNYFVKVDSNFINNYCYENKTEIIDISPINNENGKGEYVRLEKDRNFSVECEGKHSNIVVFSGAKNECFQVSEVCEKHSRPWLILASSKYHPTEAVNEGNMPTIKNTDIKNPIYPKDFFMYRDSLYVRFQKQDNLKISIYYGLRNEVVTRLEADGVLHAIPVVTATDTFRIACPDRLSYLICATHPKSVSVIFESKTNNTPDILNTNTQKYPWYIWLCIIVVLTELVILLFFIIRKIYKRYTEKRSNESNTGQLSIMNDPKEKTLNEKDSLFNTHFVTLTKKHNKKVMWRDEIQITSSNATRYIEYLLTNYYPEKDEKLKEYLNNQNLAQSNEDDIVTLQIPLYIRKNEQADTDSQDKWIQFKQTKAYYKLLPNLEDINSNTTDAIAQDLDTPKVTSWKQIHEALNQMSDSVSEDLKPKVNDICNYIDGIRKVQEETVNNLRSSLTNTTNKLSQTEILLTSEREDTKKLNLELETLQKSFDEKLNKKTAEVKKELKDTKEELVLIQKNLTEANNKFNDLDKMYKKTKDDYEKLTKQKKAVDTELLGIKQKHQKEIQEIETQHKKILNEKEQSYQSSLIQQKEDFERAMSDYVRLFRRYAGCEAYTNYTKQFFELLAKLQQAQMKLSSNVLERAIDDAEKDNFNYYFTAIINKFNKAITGLKLDEYRKELLDLNETGMTRTGKVIDQILKTSSQRKYVDDLRYRIYEDLFKQLCGASIVLSDDLGSLHKLCPLAVQQSDVTPFPKLTEQLLIATSKMGYKPVYVKLFTPYSDYAEISVEKTVNLEGTKKNDVTEILSMAINYGTHNDKTKVSANI